MLGNFSFGDYFKREIIVWSWEFVRDWLKIPENRLRVSVHEKDDEAYGIWEKEVGVRPDWIYRLGDDDNFWFMAETGPCGPDSEIFYDLGEQFGDDQTPETGGDRWVEIWNLVFTQFDRQPDGTLQPLPKKNVDTGMGLERTAMALQGISSVFEADCFKPIIDIFRGRTPAEIIQNQSHIRAGLNSFYVVSDHSRAVFMLIADGVFPGNEGRGYVLRRLLRRALVHLRRLGQHDGGLLNAFPAVLDLWGDVYPNLVERSGHIQKLVGVEEENFLRTLDSGISRLESAIESIKNGSLLPGEVAFEMFDTYGVPLDVTIEMAEAHSIKVDREGFNKLLDEARIKARSARKHEATIDAKVKFNVEIKAKVIRKTEFAGCNTLRNTTEFLEYNPEENYVVIKNTPFYAERGGQVGDTGKLKFNGGEFTVIDTRQVGQMTIHIIDPEKTIGDPSKLEFRDPIEAIVDIDRRKAIQRAHTATHLLHAALRAVLGDHVQQAGSVVEPDRLRFDFSHYQPLSKDEIRKIEDYANERVFAEHPVHHKVVPIDEARKAGAMALFGEKYGDEVRMVWVGGRETQPVIGQVESTELCGGTHVDNTGVIGMIKIVSEESVASGVRRIEAVTGRRAYQEVCREKEILGEVSSVLNVPVPNLHRGAQKLTEHLKKLEKEKKDLENQLVHGKKSADTEELTIGVITAVIFPAQSLPPDAVAKMLDDRAETEKAVVAFAVTEYDGKGTAMVRCSDAAVKAGYKAGEIIAKIAVAMGGKGGGKPTFARGGVDSSLFNKGREAFEMEIKRISGLNS